VNTAAARSCIPEAAATSINAPPASPRPVFKRATRHATLRVVTRESPQTLVAKIARPVLRRRLSHRVIAGDCQAVVLTVLPTSAAATNRAPAKNRLKIPPATAGRASRNPATRIETSDSTRRRPSAITICVKCAVTETRRGPEIRVNRRTQANLAHLHAMVAAILPVLPPITNRHAILTDLRFPLPSQQAHCCCRWAVWEWFFCVASAESPFEVLGLNRRIDGIEADQRT
jgi:hypothetical protein